MKKRYRGTKSLETFVKGVCRLARSKLISCEPDLVKSIEKKLMKGVGGGYGYPILTELCIKIEFQTCPKNSPLSSKN